MDIKESKAVDHWLEKTDEYYQDGDLHVSHFVIEGFKAGYDCAKKEYGVIFLNCVLIAIGFGYFLGNLIPAVRWF